MNGTSGLQEVQSSPPDHQRIGSCASDSLNSERVPPTFSALTISSLSPQASVQSKKRFLASCLFYEAGSFLCVPERF